VTGRCSRRFDDIEIGGCQVGLAARSFVDVRDSDADGPIRAIDAIEGAHLHDVDVIMIGICRVLESGHSRISKLPLLMVNFAASSRDDKNAAGYCRPYPRRSKSAAVTNVLFSAIDTVVGVVITAAISFTP